MRQTLNVSKPVSATLKLVRILHSLSVMAMFIVAALLLGSAVSGCSNNPPVPKVSVYRPPTALMTPAPTQYLLSPEQQRQTRSSTTAPSQP